MSYERKRDPRGIPSGGQYAAERRGEHEGVALSGPIDPRVELHRYLTQGEPDAELRAALVDVDQDTIDDAYRALRSGRPVPVKDIVPDWYEGPEGMNLPGNGDDVELLDDYRDLEESLRHSAEPIDREVYAAYESLPSDAHRNIAYTAYGDSLTREQAGQVADLSTWSVASMTASNEAYRRDPEGIGEAERIAVFAQRIEDEHLERDPAVEPTRKELNEKRVSAPKPLAGGRSRGGGGGSGGGGAHGGKNAGKHKSSSLSDLGKHRPWWTRLMGN